MPLLKKQPFVRKRPPADLQPDELIFFCSLTKEAFRDYEEFYERIILCNSLVWTCEYTGKSNFTFQEALESEAKAKKAIGNFPKEIKQPVLLLASLTCRGKIADLWDDVFVYAKDRFFVGETVEVNFNNTWKRCRITQVIPPTTDELKEKLKTVQNGHSQEGSPKSKKFWPPPEMFRYEVVDGSVKDDDCVPMHIKPYHHVRREKGLYTREKSKLFLKQNTDFVEYEGIFKVKERVGKRYKIYDLKFVDVFAGPLPIFEKSRKPVVKKIASPHKIHRISDHKLPDGINKGPSSMKNQTAQQEFEEMRKRMEEKREEARKRFEEQKLQDKEKKKEERERKKEEKRLVGCYMREWMRPREDLECSNLKDLPFPTPVKCKIPNELFGDFIMILEFVNSFLEALSFKRVYSNGLSFECLENALVGDNMQSSLAELVQVLLECIFSLQEEEDEEVKDIKEMVSADVNISESGDLSDAVKAATLAGRWSVEYLKTTIQNLQLDYLTLSEVLRLHLLSSGAQQCDSISKERYQYRGGYSNLDDPGLYFRMSEPGIIKSLATKSIYELSVGDKLKILGCLVNQILTFITVRDKLDTHMDNVNNAKKDLRIHHVTQLKREKEENLTRYKQKEEERRNVIMKLKNLSASQVENKSFYDMFATLTNREKEIVKAEVEKLDERTIKEDQKRKSENEAKEQELAEAIKNYQDSCACVPLGRDRCFRRFWIFNHIPGLFVEDNELFPGVCLPKPTLNLKELTQEKVEQAVTKQVQRIMQENDKENKSPLNYVPIFTNLQYMKEDFFTKLLCDNADTEVPSDCVFGVCSANPDTCTVHSDKANRTTWAFYSSEEQVEKLLQNLNPRGVRERELLEMLKDKKKDIMDNIIDTPIAKLNLKGTKEDTRESEQANTEEKEEINGQENESSTEEDKQTSTQEKKEKSNEKKKELKVELCHNYTPDTSIFDVYELTFRDIILEMEEKLHLGGLGHIKVGDREVWRNLIMIRQYEPQGDLNWSGKNQEVAATENLLNRSINYDDGDTEEVFNESKKVVKDLCCALLQVEQCIQEKHFKPPLGENDKQKKVRQKKEEEKQKADDEDTVKIPLLPRQYWEKSLMRCTTFSQLYIHYSVLDSSIEWSRSLLNVRCRICRRKGDEEKMLLCDGCDRGHHMYCLKPKLKSVPRGQWFCDKCKPVEKPKLQKRSRKIEEEEEEEAEEEEEQDVCSVCEKTGKLVSCSECSTLFHITCTDPPLKKLPKGKWKCSDCKPDVNCAECSDKHKHRKSAEQCKSTIADVAKSMRRSSRIESKGNEEPEKKRRATSSLSKLSKKPRYSDSHKRKSADAATSRTTKRLRSGGHRESEEKRLSVGARRAAAHTDVPLNYAMLDSLLRELTHHKESWPFLRPVTKKEAPDYHGIVKKPMDFGTMKGKLNTMKYVSDRDFIFDVLLIFYNCFAYNVEDRPEYKAALEMMGFFTKRAKEMDLGEVVRNVKKEVEDSYDAQENGNQEESESEESDQKETRENSEEEQSDQEQDAEVESDEEETQDNSDQEGNTQEDSDQEDNQNSPEDSNQEEVQEDSDQDVNVEEEENIEEDYQEETQDSDAEGAQEDSDQEETQEDSDQEEMQEDSDQEEMQEDSDQEETQEDSDENETQDDSDQDEIQENSDEENSEQGESDEDHNTQDSESEEQHPPVKKRRK